MADILQFRPRPEPEASDLALGCPGCASVSFALLKNGEIECHECGFVLPAVWDFDVSVDPEVHGND